MPISPVSVWMGPVRYYRAGRNQKPRIFVLHTAEGCTSVECLQGWMNNPNNTSQASSHYGIGQDGRIGAYVDENNTAFANPPINDESINVEMCGFAGWSRDQWMSTGAKMVDAAARLVSDVCGRYGWPLTLVSGNGTGYTDHKRVNDAYGSSDHWDVGTGFPWDVLASKMGGGGTSGEEDEMTPADWDQMRTLIQTEVREANKWWEAQKEAQDRHWRQAYNANQAWEAEKEAHDRHVQAAKEGTAAALQES